MNILIIGYGIVGHNIYKKLSLYYQPDIYDLKYAEFNKQKKHYDVAFICVDTPNTADCMCDLTQVRNALIDNEADIFIIKSTILPGSTEQLKEETGKRIVFSPEYYGNTQHCNNFEFNFTILGGDKKDCLEVQQLLQNVYDARHTFRIVDSKTAELVKYMENAWLATKVSFCNQFYNIANDIGVDYEDLRELFILDPRVNPSHTFIYNDKPYWDSHCLNKDVPAIANFADAKLIKAVIDFNENQKKKIV